MWGSRDSPNLPSGKRASFECGRGSGRYSGGLFGTPTGYSGHSWKRPRKCSGHPWKRIFGTPMEMIERFRGFRRGRLVTLLACLPGIRDTSRGHSSATCTAAPVKSHRHEVNSCHGGANEKPRVDVFFAGCPHVSRGPGVGARLAAIHPGQFIAHRQIVARRCQQAL